MKYATKPIICVSLAALSVYARVSGFEDTSVDLMFLTLLAIIFA